MSGQARSNGNNGNGRNGLSRLLRRWHRRVGLVAAVLVLLLAVTGILLSHAETFGLNQVRITAPVVLRLYAEPLRQAPRAAEAGEHWVVWIDGHVFLDGFATDARLDGLVGAVAGDELIAVAGAEALLLLTTDGALVDHIDAASLPGRIERIGRAAGGAIVLATADGVFATHDGLDFAPMDEGGDVRWSDPLASAPAAALAPALAAYRGEGVTLHRIVADLHSGRFMGSVGPYVMDAAALGLILLAGSGFILWRRRR